jgi:hypothetical protein
VDFSTGAALSQRILGSRDITSEIQGGGTEQISYDFVEECNPFRYSKLDNIWATAMSPSRCPRPQR